MERFLLIAAGIIFMISCKTNKNDGQNINLTKEKLALLDADLAFSKLCGEKGMKNAYLEYIDSNGILLRPGYAPLKGGDAIDFLMMSNDDNFKITWNPSTAFVAASADLGYTYGLYALRPSDIDTVLYGSYVSIWKKQQGGKWKFVLQTQQEGLGESEKSIAQ